MNVKSPRATVYYGLRQSGLKKSLMLIYPVKEKIHTTCMNPKQFKCLLRKEESYLDCLFFLGSSIAKI